MNGTLARVCSNAPEQPWNQTQAHRNLHSTPTVRKYKQYWDGGLLCTNLRRVESCRIPHLTSPDELVKADRRCLPFRLSRSRSAELLWCRWPPGGRQRPDTGTTCGSPTAQRQCLPAAAQSQETSVMTGQVIDPDESLWVGLIHLTGVQLTPLVRIGATRLTAVTTNSITMEHPRQHVGFSLGILTTKRQWWNIVNFICISGHHICSTPLNRTQMSIFPSVMSQLS